MKTTGSLMQRTLTERGSVRDLPDVPARISEAGGADPPGPVHRPVQELHSSLLQLGAHRVHVRYFDRELEAPPGVLRLDLGRVDESWGLRHHEQIDEGRPEPKYRRILGLEDHRQTKCLGGKRLRRGEG